MLWTLHCRTVNVGKEDFWSTIKNETQHRRPQHQRRETYVTFLRSKQNNILTAIQINRILSFKPANQPFPIGHLREPDFFLSSFLSFFPFKIHFELIYNHLTSLLPFLHAALKWVSWLLLSPPNSRRSRVGCTSCTLTLEQNYSHLPHHYFSVLNVTLNLPTFLTSNTVLVTTLFQI